MTTFSLLPCTLADVSVIMATTLTIWLKFWPQQILSQDKPWFKMNLVLFKKVEKYNLQAKDYKKWTA